jgi:hypothetical protein
MSILDDLQAKRGCPVCVRSWRLILAGALAAVIVAVAMLRWHGGGSND